MKKEFKLSDIPDEVMEAWAMMHETIGIEQHNKMREIIKKYPEWFVEERPAGFELSNLEKIKLRRGGWGAAMIRRKYMRLAMGLDKEYNPANINLRGSGLKAEVDMGKWMHKAMFEKNEKKPVNHTSDAWDMMMAKSHFLDHCYVKTDDGLKKMEWRDRDKAEFDRMLKIMDNYEIKGRIRGRRREYLIVQARRYGFSEQLLMAQKKDREKKLNGRSWTRRYEREWLKKKAESMSWYKKVQREHLESFSKELSDYTDDLFTRYHEHLRQGLRSSE